MGPHGATGAAPRSPSGALPRSALLGEPALEEALLEAAQLEAAQHGLAAAQGLAAADKAALAPRVVASYSLGHVLNDLSASAWFSYLIFFLKKVRHLPAPGAGLVMLCGQLADALGTVSSGLLSDRSEGCAPLGLGRRKLWYIAGTGTVAGYAWPARGVHRLRVLDGLRRHFLVFRLVCGVGVRDRQAQQL
jgi:hypothetical protein